MLVIQLVWYIAMFLVTSPTVINVPTRGLLVIETMDAIVRWLANLNIKSNMTSMFVNKKHRYTKAIIHLSVGESGGYLPPLRWIIVSEYRSYIHQNETALKMRPYESFTFFFNCFRVERFSVNPQPSLTSLRIDGAATALKFKEWHIRLSGCGE